MSLERWTPAAWLIALALASPPHATGQPADTQFRAVPPSALSTCRDLRFVTTSWNDGEHRVTLLAYQPEGQAPRPVARLLQRRHADADQTSVQRLPTPAAPVPAVDLDLAVLEQMYTLVFRSSPLARYCIGAVADETAPPCNVDQDGVSHARALQDLARLRERAALNRPGALPWHLVEIEPVARQSLDIDHVAVRLIDTAGPLARQPIYFNRAPHSICTARADEQGRAACRLEDQHGDGSQHSHAVDVVATFPGDLRPDRVLLPTTVVLTGLPGRMPAPFARPLAWPASATP